MPKQKAFFNDIILLVMPMLETFMTEDEIKKELEDYFYNVNIKYATLLNGSWGSGKTYFVKNFIKEMENKYKENKEKYRNPIYLSLYGINSISEIKSKLSLSLFKNEKIKKAIPFVDVCLEIGGDIVQKYTSVDDADKKVTKLLGSFQKLDNLVIFFDDLERCNMNINTILGYINELVEHNDVKVVIIADESKIGKVNYNSNLELKYITALSSNFKIEKKKDKKDYWSKDTQQTENNDKITKNELIERTKFLFDEDNIYSEIKEKLIGKIIYYRANIEDVYKTFVNDIITNELAKETVLKNKEKFLEQINRNKHYNLRTIQFIFQSFNRLVIETIEIIDLKDIKNIYLDNLFSYTTIKSLQIKQGNNSYNWENNQQFGTVFLNDGLLDYIYSNYVIGFRFVDDFLLNSYINKVSVKDTLTQYKANVLNEIKNPNDPLYKLKNWWIISENDLKSILEKLLEKTNNNDYELNVYSNIVMILSRIEEMDVCKTLIKKIIIQLENNIKSNKVKGTFCEERLFDVTPETEAIYKKNIGNIRLYVEERELKNLQSEIDTIFNSNKWGEELKNYCANNNGKFLGDKKFAYILDLNKIENNIINGTIDQIYQFWYALQKIYNFSNIKDYYENDKEKLIELKNKIGSITITDKVKVFVLKKIEKFLNDVISNL